MGPVISCFGLLVTSALGFKARADPSFATPADYSGNFRGKSPTGKVGVANPLFNFVFTETEPTWIR